MKRSLFCLLAAAILLVRPHSARAADAGRQADAWVPTLSPIENPSPSELASVVARFTSDRDALSRHYDAPHSPDRRAALRDFTKAWQTHLETIDFESLGVEGRIDWILLATRLRHDQRLLDREEKRLAEAAPLLPFAPAILGLADARRRLDTADPKDVAKTLADIDAQIEKARKAVEAGLPSEPGKDSAAAKPAPNAAAALVPLKPTKIVAYRSAAMAKELRETLTSWFHYYDGYDPLFSWWCEAPYKKADGDLEKYVKFLREKVVGGKEGDDEPIVGDPIGREAIQEDLADEMIPYTPEELIAIAEREFAWCEDEMKKASREMGFGDDWKKALEKVKTLHVEPGKQPDLVRDLHREAVDFVRAHDLVTVPPLADVDLAHGDDVARTAAGESVLPRRRGDPRLLPDGHHVGGRQAHEHARQQHPLLARHGVPRADPGPSPAGLHGGALQPAPRRLRTRRFSSKAGRCTGRCCSGTSVSRRRPRTASACCSGACTAARGSSSR